ncbi:MAG: radical SAM protein, partial [Promethearchaeota archaeon]
KWVRSPHEAVINQTFQEFSKILGVGKVEYLIGYEGNAFAFTGNVEADLLGITAVHPMRKEAVEVLLKKANTNWDVVAKLLKEEKIIKVEFEENEYYLRKLPTRKI